MGDLLKYITEKKEDGEPKREREPISINFFDAMDNCGKEIRCETIADVTPAASFCDRPSERDKP